MTYALRAEQYTCSLELSFNVCFENNVLLI